MTNIDAEYTDKILLLNLSIKFHEYNLSHSKLEHILNRTLYRFYANLALNLTRNPLEFKYPLYVQTDFEKGLMDRSQVTYLGNPDTPKVFSISDFDFRAEATDGSIIIEGEIRIKSTTLAIILFFFFGGFDFFSKYDNAVSGIQSFMTHVEAGYEGMINMWQAETPVSEQRPKEVPIPNQVANAILAQVREDDFREYIERTYKPYLQ